MNGKESDWREETSHLEECLAIIRGNITRCAREYESRHAQVRVFITC